MAALINAEAWNSSRERGTSGDEWGMIPSDAREFQSAHYGWAVPTAVHGWQWSTTFGRWSALVTFADGWHGFTYPRLAHRVDAVQPECPAAVAARGIVTGGQRAMQCVQLLDMPGRWCLFGTVGTLSHELDTGGPLDAPERMPAGGLSCTEWRDGCGRALVRQLEAWRD